MSLPVYGGHRAQMSVILGTVTFAGIITYKHTRTHILLNTNMGRLPTKTERTAKACKLGFKSALTFKI